LSSFVWNVAGYVFAITVTEYVSVELRKEWDDEDDNDDAGDESSTWVTGFRIVLLPRPSAPLFLCPSTCFLVSRVKWSERPMITNENDKSWIKNEKRATSNSNASLTRQVINMISNPSTPSISRTFIGQISRQPTHYPTPCSMSINITFHWTFRVFLHKPPTPPSTIASPCWALYRTIRVPPRSLNFFSRLPSPQSIHVGSHTYTRAYIHTPAPVNRCGWFWPGRASRLTSWASVGSPRFHLCSPHPPCYSLDCGLD
jgi:hypothetical protein